MKNYITVTLKIGGMTCVNCENRIERTLKNKKGIANAIVSWGKGTALVTYDPEKTSIGEIIGIIAHLGYEAVKPNGNTSIKPVRRSGGRSARSAAGSLYETEPKESGEIQVIKAVAILLIFYMLLSHTGILNLFNYFPQASAGMGYGMLFVIGILTSAHCIAMCGGINLSQCVPYQASGAGNPYRASGADDRSASGNKNASKGSGISTLKPSFLYNTGRVISYTVIGGLVGALSSVLTKKHTAKMMTVSAAFVILLGAAMLSRGMALGGFTLPFGPGGVAGNPAWSSQGGTAVVSDGFQTVTTSLDSGRYVPIVVQKGIPVRWTIQAEARDINGCNNAIIIPEYDMGIRLEPGDNIIKFTPEEAGVIGYSCWMGMIKSQITVVDQL